MLVKQAEGSVAILVKKAVLCSTIITTIRRIILEITFVNYCPFYFIMEYKYI